MDGLRFVQTDDGDTTVRTTRAGYLLRVFLGEGDKLGHIPLYEAIVRRARDAGLAGATVLRGLMGYGQHSVLHTAKVLRLSEDLPMVVEIVDQVEKIEAFLPILEPIIGNGLVTLEQVQVVRFQQDDR